MSLDSPDSPGGRLRKGSYSFYEEDMLQLEELARQRKRKKDTDLQKEAMHSGTLIETIREEPDPITGKYGNLEVKDLVKMIRPLIVTGADWLAQQGYPLTPSGGAEALTTLLGALAVQGVGGGPQTSLPMRREPEQDRQAEGPFIRGNVLENLGLDDDPVL